MSRPLCARVYLASVVLAAGGCLAYWLHAWRGPVPAAPGLMALLVGLAVAAQHFPLLLAPRCKVDVADAVYFACLLLFGAPLAILLVGASQLLGQGTLALRRSPTTGKRLRSPRSVLFNTAQFMLATGLAGLAYYAVLPHQAPAPLGRTENLWAVPAAAAAMYLANSGAVAAMAGLQLGRTPLAVWRAGRRSSAAHGAALLLLGLVTALTAVHHPWAPLALALPTALVSLSLKRTVQLTEQTIAAVEALADAVDLRDPYTGDHSRRVAACAERLARRLGLPGEEVDTIRLAARVHDLGKLGIPDAVLLKPGRLTPEERALMERHSELGYQILARFPEYRRGRELVRAHHERVDGRGYPQGLRGDALPLGAQIIAVADALDALTSDRPYRRGLPLEEALAELRRGKGTQWRADVVEALEGLLAQPDGQRPVGARVAAAA